MFLSRQHIDNVHSAVYNLHSIAKVVDQQGSSDLHARPTPPDTPAPVRHSHKPPDTDASTRPESATALPPKQR